MKQFIRNKILVVPTDMSIRGVLKSMIDMKLSSALVKNDQLEICGIVTERDVIRKLVMLEIDSKLEHKIGVFMTRPLHVARVTHLTEDVKRLHADYQVRHFPVVKSEKSLHETNFVGIITLSDLARAYLDGL